MEKVKEKPKKKKIRNKAEADNTVVESEPLPQISVHNVIEDANDISSNLLDDVEYDIIEIQANSDQCVNVLNIEQLDNDTHVEIAQDMVSVTQEVLQCEEIQQPDSIVTAPSAPSFRELNALVNQFQKLEFIQESVDALKTHKEVKSITPFTFEEIENVFGMKEINNARTFSAQFEEHNIIAPLTIHPLYEALYQYQRARSQMILNQKEISALLAECEKKQMAIWTLENKTMIFRDTCEDKNYVSYRYKYLEATLQSDILAELQKDLQILRDKATEVHSMHSHQENLCKIQVNDLLWTSIVTGTDLMKDALNVLFYTLRTSGWGFDKQLRQQLRNWCCLVTEGLLKHEDTMNNLLFVLHHIIRVPQGIRWALHLIKCEVKSVNDIYKAFCLLEVILIITKHSDIRINTPNTSKNDDELVVASEAGDDALWLIVDSDGEHADIEINGTQNKIVLKESDILGLIRQIPFENIFQELMVVRYIEDDVMFCGKNLCGGSVLKVFATFRIFLNIIRFALISFKKYVALTKELCRLALHSVMYCSDLWEVASSECEANLIERLCVEYDNIFLAGVSALECAGSREISTMFIAEMPFKFCKIDHVVELYQKISDNLIVSDSIWCYYTFVTISNMAVIRKEDKLVSAAIKKLFDIGFLSDFTDLGCGEWARTLCGIALKKNLEFMSPTLNNIPPETPGKWLDNLPLSHWTPNIDELMQHLTIWKESKPSLVPFLLKSLNWNVDGGFNLEIQRGVAVFLSIMTQKYTQAKTNVPEWIWECLLALKIHHIDWRLNLTSAPHPECFVGIDFSGKCHVTNTVLMLTTSWGHSLPLILQHSAPCLVKLASIGRFTEVAHVLNYIVLVLAESPESIVQNKFFKELLMLILKEERSLHKMAVRLLSKDFPSANIKLLLEVMKSHLINYTKFSYSSPTPLMVVWIHWITSLDNWQCDWIAVYLLDMVLGYCFFFQDAMNEASRIFKSFIQSPTSPRSPNSSSFGSWLFNNSSTFKGLIQCSIEVPFVWHVVLWLEHFTVERNMELWQNLAEKLHLQKEGTKINIDKTFKSVGGGDSSSYLVIYRSIQCAIATPLSHPIYSLIWQCFFYMYLNTSVLRVNSYVKPVGPLFFQGTINSKVLAKAKARLLEAKLYHEDKNKSLLNADEKLYHLHQARLMDTFHMWLGENFFDDPSQMFSHPFSEQLRMLISGQTFTWTETIDLHEYEKYLFISNIKSGSPIPSVKSKEFSCEERILNRIKTYEKPIKICTEKFNDTQLVPIIDPTINNDLRSAYNMLKNNLKQLHSHSKKYITLRSNIIQIDKDLYSLLGKLYTKNKINFNRIEKCGNTCMGGANINVSGFESQLNTNTKATIFYNREKHKVAIDQSTESYLSVSLLTAAMSKLSQLACNGMLPATNDIGIKLFNLVLEALKNENLNFPPANHVLNNIATQLGEKFVRKNGTHCINLVNRMKHIGNDALICSLLRPLDLPTNEMLNLYAIINSSVADFHVAFSCLSKFRISVWLHETRPSVNDRNILIAHICEALAFTGCEPPPEKLMLQELLCVHLGHLLAWEFPVHLNQVLSYFHKLSLEKKLPPDCWEHCFMVIEKYPHMISHQQACSNMDLIGREWWSKRGTWGLHGLYDRYNLYTTAMTRLGALLTSCVLSTSMVHQPLLLTHQICSVVFNSMCSFWNVWLVPKWDTPQTIWSNDWLTKSPPLMPWGPDDNVVPEIMLDAFVETLTYCIETLPGSGDDFLRLTWLWYFSSYPHIAIGTHVLGRVHKALLKLPWSIDCNQWITYSELQTMYKISMRPLPSCHTFTLHCIGDRTWKNWINVVPQQIQTNALHMLLLLFLKLRPEHHVLDDLLQLPWHHLKVKQYEEVLEFFMNSMNNTEEPFYGNPFFSVLCAVGGLKENRETGVEWQLKRTSLINKWIDGLLEIVERKSDATQKRNVNKTVGLGIGDMLQKIEVTVMNLAVSDTQKLSECTMLLNSAIMMINMVSLQEIGKMKFIEWAANTSKLCVESLVGCILSLTQDNIFAEVSEHTLSIYFSNGGNWNYILSLWKHNCIVPIKFLIDNNILITAFATYTSLDIAKYEGKQFDTLHRHILYSLYDFVPTSTLENQTILWVLYLSSLVTVINFPKENQTTVYAQVTSILEKWSEEPGLWKTYVQNIAPSPKFRIITKYAYCSIINANENLKGESSSSNAKDVVYKKFVASVESCVDLKQYSSVKHILVEYIGYLKEQGNKTNDNVMRNILGFCSNLYSDSNYITKVSDIFK